MDIGFIVDTKPVIVKGLWGTRITFSDGEIHYLTIWERICVRFLGETAEQLQEELRPRLAHDIKAYKQSQAYTKSKHIGAAVGQPLRCLTQTQQVPLAPIFGIEKLDSNIGVDTQIGVRVAPLNQQQPIIHTVDQEMKYFVWKKTMLGPQAQLWADDYSVSYSSNKPIEGIIQKIELKGKERILPLGILSEMYPCPEVKEKEDDKDKG